MITPKPRVLEFMFEKYLQKYICEKSVSLDEWSYTKGLYTAEGEYKMEEASSVIHLGDRWQTGYDEAHIFEKSAFIPDDFTGSELRLELNIGGESLVSVNGKILGSATCGNPRKHRETIMLTGFHAGDRLDIRIEAGVNSGDFCDAAMGGAKSTEYTFAKASIVQIDTLCESYCSDLALAFDALKHIKDEHIRAAVYRAVDDSLHMVDFDFEPERVRKSIGEAAEYFRAQLSAIQYQPQSEVIFTGHSHIDVAWLWRIQESVRKSARTFSNVVSLMDKYPEMTFAQSQAVLYDMTKKYYPAVYERIKEKIRNGQWDIVGNVWVEADTNLASGEALIRQLLYGREYFMKEFGKASDTYWLPDCFGFSWALPQIIKRSGMKNFLTSKLNNNDTNRFPHTLFRWKGNNGDEILAYLQRASYNGEYDLGDIESAETGDEKNIVSTTMAMFGHGDGGGGPTYPMLERGRRLKNYPGLPKTEIGHVDGFFEKISEQADELPVWNGEMYYENHRGTYTSQAFVKKYNRMNEYLLSRGEMLNVFAAEKAGSEYPKDEIEDCWKIMLTNQFHDILPGSSIHEVYDDCRRDYAALTKRTEAVRDSALAKLNARVKCDGESVIVWNLTSFEQRMPVTLKVPSRVLRPVDKNGTALPCRIAEADGEFILTFIPDSLPPMGYKVFRLADAPDAVECVRAESRLLENSKLRVELDENGIITSVFDKVNSREALDGRGNILTVSQDKCVHETAWNLEVNYQKKMWELTGADSIEVTEASPRCGTIRIVRSFNKSKITQDIILNADDDVIYFDTTVDWHETDKVLKAGFDAAVLNTEASFEIAHGAIRRPTHRNNSFDKAMFEVCAHKWADLSECGYGLSILNNCKYGYDILDSHMRITLMRAPTCPDPVGDHGINSFIYALYPHKNTWQDAETVSKALALNLPALAFYSKSNPGEASEKSFASLDCGNVIVEAIKPAQDGRGFIVRVVETEQRRGAVKLTLSLNAERAVETNLMEQDEVPADYTDGVLSFNIKPFEVKTFRLF